MKEELIKNLICPSCKNEALNILNVADRNKAEIRKGEI